VPRHLVPRLVAAVVAAIGVLLLASGALLARSGGSEQNAVARLTAGSVPVVTTVPGMLTLNGTRVRVQADAANGSSPVFLGVARTVDAQAYLGQVARQEVTGTDSGGLTSVRRGSEPSLPDPAGVDIWAVSVRGQGSAALTWPGEPGSWRLVVATDGRAPAPRSLSLTWNHPPGGSAAPALIAVGLLLIVGGLVTLVVQWSRRSAQRDDEPTDYPYGEAEGRAGEGAAAEDGATTVLRRVPAGHGDRAAPGTAAPGTAAPGTAAPGTAASDQATTLLRRVPAGPEDGATTDQATDEAGAPGLGDDDTTLLRRTPDADPPLRRPRSRRSRLRPPGAGGGR